jgi:hypothetical protein
MVRCKDKNLTFIIFFAFICYPAINGQVKWDHISSKTGGIEAPNNGKEQTSSAVADFDNDGINDFCISERTTAPALVWYRLGRGSSNWPVILRQVEKSDVKKYYIEDEAKMKSIRYRSKIIIVIPQIAKKYRNEKI